jgi:5-amino-6-(5-phospho-D-ribitylamino)uracil phosphatase
MSILYVSDLDGTLLDNEARLSDFARESLAAMLRDGLPFTVATARSIFSVRQILGDLPLTLPVVEFNGAYLTDYESGRHLTIRSMSSDVVSGVCRMLPVWDLAPFISRHDDDGDRLLYGDIVNEGMEWFMGERYRMRDPRLVHFADLCEVLRGHVVCITVVGLEEPVRELEEAVLAKFGPYVDTHLYENRYCPGWYWLTINDARATKDQAIDELRQSFAPGHRELVVFGDDVNDITMFRQADRAIAVANAVDAVKKHATDIIGANLDDSVVKYLAREWSRRRSAAQYDE